MRRVIAILLVALSALNHPPAHAESNRGGGEYYSVNGARLYVESFGHGAPIVFLHGGLMFFDNAYAKQRDYFAANQCYWLWAQPVVIDTGDLKKIPSPVLVVAGDHAFTSIEETTEIFRGLPHGQLFLVPGTGHGTFRTRPDVVNLVISEFLDQPDNTGQTH